jgi:rhomboid family GlyGly-CTERM serine protease
MTDGEPVKARLGWLQVLHLQGARGGLLAIACGGLLLPSVWPALTPLLRYERAALTNDQWWRWGTAHLVHLDTGHALLNAIGLILLWTLFAGLLRARDWLWTLGLSVVTVDLGLWFLQPQLQWYVGASGVLHGVMAGGCVALLRSGDRAAWPASVLFTAKLAWEHWQGPLPFETQSQVVSAAHLYGAAGGLLAALPEAAGAAILRRCKPEVSH